MVEKDEVTPNLRDRPWDEKMKIPIPLSNIMPDGSTNYRAINGEMVFMLASSHRCALCGKELNYWVAFIGGPRAFESGAYQDGPMHPLCAFDALRLCPHMFIGRHKGWTDEKHDAEGNYALPGHLSEKPESVVLGVTRNYKVNVVPIQGAERSGFFFSVKNWKRHYVCEYGDDGKLQIPPHELEKE